MKKYIKPTSVQYDVATEGIIAASLNINDQPGNQQLSIRKSGWNSDDWTADETDVEEDY